MTADKSPSLPVTETMAQLLLEQRHWREAVEIYLELGRRLPEKKADYQKKVVEIKDFFATPARQEKARAQRRIGRRVEQLKGLLRQLDHHRGPESGS